MAIYVIKFHAYNDQQMRISSSSVEI